MTSQTSPMLTTSTPSDRPGFSPAPSLRGVGALTIAAACALPLSGCMFFAGAAAGAGAGYIVGHETADDGHHHHDDDDDDDA